MKLVSIPVKLVEQQRVQQMTHVLQSSQMTLIICLLPGGKGIISWILSEMVIRADIFRIPTPQLKGKHLRNLEHAM